MKIAEATTIAKTIHGIYPNWNLTPAGQELWVEAITDLEYEFDKVKAATKEYLVNRNDPFAPVLGEYIAEMNKKLGKRKLVVAI